MLIADASSAHKIQAQVCAFYWVVEEETCKVQHLKYISVKSHSISHFTDGSMGKERKSEMLILF